jgi:hypothetical protein
MTTTCRTVPPADRNGRASVWTRGHYVQVYTGSVLAGPSLLAGRKRSATRGPAGQHPQPARPAGGSLRELPHGSRLEAHPRGS